MGVLFLPAPQAQAHHDGTDHEFELRYVPNEDTPTLTLAAGEGDGFTLHAKWRKTNPGLGSTKNGVNLKGGAIQDSSGNKAGLVDGSQEGENPPAGDL